MREAKQCRLQSGSAWVKVSMRGQVIVAVIIQCMVLATCGDVSATAVVPVIPERRAIFDEDFGWVTPQGAEATLRRIKAAGFNALVVCVWHGRGVSWPSDLSPMEPRWKDDLVDGHDPLGYLVRRAHEEGIEVHAWFTIALRQREFLNEFYDGVGYGSEIGRSFNIHRPAFREYMVSVIQEVVERYDVDGVNLDYMRAMGVCTSEYCVGQYRAASGRDLRRDVREMHRSRESWQAISAWNAASVRDFVERVSVGVRSVRAGILVSVDTHVGKPQLELQGVDSLEWANTGLIDLIYEMSYESELDLLEMTATRGLLRDPKKIAILVGNFERSILDKNRVWSREGSKVRHHMQSAITFGERGQGSALYVYKFLSDDQVAQLKVISPAPLLRRAKW
jgi:hypothetical protein